MLSQSDQIAQFFVLNLSIPILDEHVAKVNATALDNELTKSQELEPENDDELSQLSSMLQTNTTSGGTKLNNTQKGN